MLAFVKLARPHQYLKNAFVFVGAIFGGIWTPQLAVEAFTLFAAFCAMASAVYVGNDIFDVEADRAHPKKRFRPIAAGQVSERAATIFALLLALTGVLLAAAISWTALAILVAYAVMQYGYSRSWKHIVVIDVFIISAGFMLRILIGTVGLGIPPSSWLLLCGLMVTLFLGFAKRHSELAQIDPKATQTMSTRQVLDQYSPVLVEQFMSISVACTILAYSLYTVAPETIERHNTGNLIFSVPFVIYGMFRYLFLLHNDQYGTDASREIVSDRHMLGSAVGWVVVVMLVLAAHR